MHDEIVDHSRNAGKHAMTVTRSFVREAEQTSMDDSKLFQSNLLQYWRPPLITNKNPMFIQPSSQLPLVAYTDAYPTGIGLLIPALN